jgi:Xaa-Pro aminopeptidase
LIISPIYAVNAADIWVKDLYFYGDPGLDQSIPPRNPFTTAEQHIYDRLQTPYDHATATDALLQALRDRGLGDGRIGMEMEGLPRKIERAIERGVPGASIRNVSNMLRLIRMVKSPEEITRLRRAAEINERVATATLSLARPGRRMADLTASYVAGIAEHGAALDHFAWGINGLGLATEPDYVLKENDVLFMDYGCIYKQYYSDTGLSLITGALPLDLWRRYEAQRAAMAAGQALLQPGVSASEVRGAMWRALNADSQITSFPHGHGFGLDVRDYPIIVDDNGLRIRDDCVDVASDLLLETDMVLNLEVPIFMPGVASMHIEQSFVVTAGGGELLVPQDRARPFFPTG